VKLATIRTGTGTTAVRVEEDGAVEVGAVDLGELLTRPDWKAAAASADGARHDIAGLDYATLIPRPEKVFCVGLNYRTHILEMGRELPEYPTLFAKFARALIGAYDPIELPAGSREVDWEAELGVVIGTEVRYAIPHETEAAIAGYTVVNDITARDFQYRSVPTGTPGGVGHARKPPRYLTEGSRLATRIEGLGEQCNILVTGGTGA
jgi:acylpyruvate hydrolase